MRATSLTQHQVICAPTCHHTLANGRTTATPVAEVLEKRSTWKGTLRRVADKLKLDDYNQLFSYNYYIIIVNITKYCVSI